MRVGPGEALQVFGIGQRAMPRGSIAFLFGVMAHAPPVVLHLAVRAQAAGVTQVQPHQVIVQPGRQLCGRYAEVGGHLPPIPRCN